MGNQAAKKKLCDPENGLLNETAASKFAYFGCRYHDSYPQKDGKKKQPFLGKTNTVKLLSLLLRLILHIHK